MALLFQYNPCYCSISSYISSNTITKRFNTTLVTVLCFNACNLFFCSSYVSIQPLLLFYSASSSFILSCTLFQYNPCYCSIRQKVTMYDLELMFQYNPCYCSMVVNQFLFLYYLGFNTTLVTVLFITIQFIMFA